MKLMTRYIRFWGLGAMLVILGSAAMGQNEKEPISRYRVVSDFEMPTVETNEGTSMGIDPLAMDDLPTMEMDSDSVGITYHAQPELWTLVDIHLRQNNALKEAEGFRIQIYAGSSLESANDAKADFIEVFDDDDFNVYQMWNPPHFRVRIGDFLSRNAAMREVAMVRQIFPDAFIVSDRVKLPRYKKPNPLEDLEEENSTKAEGNTDQELRQN